MWRFHSVFQELCLAIQTACLAWNMRNAGDYYNFLKRMRKFEKLLKQRTKEWEEHIEQHRKQSSPNELA